VSRYLWYLLTSFLACFGQFAAVAGATEEGGVPAAAERSPFPVPQVTPRRTDVKPFEYIEAKIAYYPPGGARRGDGQWNRMQLPLSPAESMRHMVTPVGFRVELFAAEPEIGKAICLNWDERGRLWVAETVDYPNDMQPPGQGRDRIRICEDTDGDGRADKFTVFAEELSIPTSLTFAHGGVILTQAPYTLFLQDTDGDDVADVRQELFGGWGINDTHAGPSNLHYGLDNWYWGIVGYSGFNGTVGGEKHSFSMGFYRFQVSGGAGDEADLRPTASRLEFLRNTNNNSWGVGFSEEGFLFGSTANRNPSVYMPIPNRYYERVRGWSSSVLGGIADTHLFKPITDKVRQVDCHGGYTSGAGHALYTARTYPQEYWNRTALVNGPTGHLTGVFVLQRDGTDFRSHNPFNLLASEDEWTAPIMAEVGPDGHVWIIDWYNYIVQHNPTPAGFETGKGNAYATELRDKRHARIYRVVYEAAPATRPFSLAGASPAELVAALRHPNMLWRKHAQRLLVERAKRDVVPMLVELVEGTSVDEIGLNVGAIHALWTMHGLGALADSNSAAVAAAIGALRHPSAGVRRNALMVIPRDEASLAAILEAGSLFDGDAHVRMAALLALSEMPANNSAAEAVIASLEDERNLADRWIPDAATSAAAAHAGEFLARALRLERAPQKALGTIAVVAEHYARGGGDSRTSASIAALPDADEDVATAVLQGFAKGWPADQQPALSAAAQQAVGKLLTTLPPAARGQLIKLAVSWGGDELEQHVAEVVQSLLATVTDEKADETMRGEAARQLVAFQPHDEKLAGKVMRLVTPRTSPGLATGLIESLRESQASGTPRVIIDGVAGLTPGVRDAAIRVLLSRPEWTGTLLDAVESGEMTISDLSLEQTQLLSAHPNKDVRRRATKLLAKGGGLPDKDREKVLEAKLALADKTGDVVRGKEVYTKHCSKCHVHSGEGERIGPDLTGMSVHPKQELLTQVLDPSRNLAGTYRAYTVVTDDGLIRSGMLASETKTTIELRDTEGKKHIVLREEIDEFVATRKSIMPDGFEKQIDDRDLVDLLEFLTAKGTYVPLPLAATATAVSTRGLFTTRDDSDRAADMMVFADWGPKTFAGVPFLLVDPRGRSTPNIILLHGPQGVLPPRMPKSVRLPCNTAARGVHLLSGVSGWGYPARKEKTVSMIVRLHYADDQTEDHPLENGAHFADYIRRVDVPKSQFAFALRGQQVRYLAIHPRRDEVIREVELVKGNDATSPIVMAVTVETR